MSKKTIVLIDSDINLVEDLQRRFMLEPDFKIVGVATTGADGFAKIQAEQPDFAVIANPLPDTDAVQLLHSITVSTPKVRKIVSLEVENPMLTSQCIQAGALYTLTKPYSADKLIEIMKRIESKPPAYAVQDHFQGSQNLPQGFGGSQGSSDNAGGNTYDQLKTAMSQFSNEQSAGGGYSQGPSNFPSQGGFNQFGEQQPYQQQPGPMGGGVYPQNQGGAGFGHFPQPQQPHSPMMGDGDHMNPGMGGGFPPPQIGHMGQMGGSPMPPHNMNMQQAQHGQMGMNQMGVMQNRQGGFRTLKQTVIAVNCPKGGVGKTTISKELAIAFANVKIGGQPLKVCLVDCDLDFGDVSSMLNLQPYPNIVHWTSDIAQRLRENPNGQIKYTQQQIESKYLLTHPTGLKILAAPSSHSDALNITEKEMEIVIDNLKACDFDVIILDTGNNTKDYTLIALDKAQIILMVATLDLTTINDTSLLLNTLKSIQFPVSKIRLIVNKMPRRDKDIDVHEISQVLGAPVIGIIPEFPRIRQLNNSGTPAMLGRDNEFNEAIRKIGNTIVPVFNRSIPPSRGGGGGPNKKKGGFFSRFGKK